MVAGGGNLSCVLRSRAMGLLQLLYRGYAAKRAAVYGVDRTGF